MVEDKYEDRPFPLLPCSFKWLQMNGSNWLINSRIPRKLPFFGDPISSLSPRSGRPLSHRNLMTATTRNNNDFQYEPSVLLISSICWSIFPKRRLLKAKVVAFVLWLCYLRAVEVKNHHASSLEIPHKDLQMLFTMAMKKGCKENKIFFPLPGSKEPNPAKL